MKYPKITYLYCNVYLHPVKGYLLYVGSHTWRGPTGVLDSSYKGSSDVVRQYNWNSLLIRTIFIKNVPLASKWKSEFELITIMWKLYGIYPTVRDRWSWLKEYPAGIMLNGHRNNLENAILKTKNEGPTAAQVAQRAYARAKAGKHVRSEEERERARHLHEFNKPRKISEEQHAKLIDARVASGYKESTSKGQETRKGHKPIYRVVECNGIVGYVQTVCRLIGHEGWNCYVTRKLQSGLTEVIHHGYVFKLISSTE